MPRYRFPVRNITRRLFKDTGAVELLDDASARAYGQRVIEELNRVGGEFIITLRLAYVRPVPVGRGTAPPRPDHHPSNPEPLELPNCALGDAVCPIRKT